MDILYGVFVAIALSVLITLFQKRKRQSTWKGTVTKIKENSYNPSVYSENNTNFQDYVDIYYRTDSGKKGKIHIYKRQFDLLYSQLKEGDKLIKKIGKEYPEIGE